MFTKQELLASLAATLRQSLPAECYADAPPNAWHSDLNMDVATFTSKEDAGGYSGD